MSDEAPFTVSVPQETLDRLQQKLALVDLPTAAPDSNDEWDYGVPLQDIQRLVSRWRNGYNWRAAEAAINAELPQFTRTIEIDGFGSFTAHYVHKKSGNANAIPLLFLHGWPGHFAEVRRILRMLVSPEAEGAPSFHVVAPSHPGFGFSSAPTKKGFAAAQYAEFAHKLMLALGYNEYISQGGDWGFIIGQRIATMYGPQHAKAWHTNFPSAWPPSATQTPWVYLKYLLTSYSTNEKKGLERTDWFAGKGHGYFLLQNTYPQTIGYSLPDSPVGLLAWIYEKLVTWTDGYSWEDDEVLDWVSIYLFSRSGPAASVRIYYETHTAGDFEDIVAGKLWSYIPLGVSIFPRELRVVPKTWRNMLGNGVFESSHEKGGHFAAHETPEALVTDLRKMFGRGGAAYGVVRGKEGY